METPNPAVARRKTVSRAVYATFGLLVTAFIVHSTVQVVRTIFYADAAPVRPLAEPCASRLRQLMSAIDRASAAETAASDERGARDAFRAALAPEWNDLESVRSSCAGPDEEDALAATERLERAYEAHAGDRAARTSEMRRDALRRIGSPTRTDSR